MSKDANRCIFTGNLTADVAGKYMVSGDMVANGTIAVNDAYKTREGERKETTEFVNLVFYRKLAETASEYCKKGGKLYVETKLKTRTYQDKEGQTKYVTEFIVDTMLLLSGKPADKAAVPAAQQRAAAPQQNFDDDIPF